MPLALLLIIIGIVLAILVNYALGIVCILIGLVLLAVAPARRCTRRRPRLAPSTKLMLIFKAAR